MHMCSGLSLILAFGASSASPGSPRPAVGVQLNLEEGFQFTVKIARERRSVTEGYPEERLDDRRKFHNHREKVVFFRCAVTERCTNGDLRIRFQYERIMDQSSRASDAYDSSEPNRDPRDNSTRVELLDALPGRSFVARLSAHGEVQEVEGFADMYRGLRDEMLSPPPWMDRYRGDLKNARRKRWAEHREHTLEKFFSRYWPLSEDALRATVQECFVVWSQDTVGREAAWHTQDVDPTVALRKYNSWTLRTQTADSVIVDLAGDVRTDLNLCDPAAVDTDYKPPWNFDGDYLTVACRWHRDGMHPPMYAGERKGSFRIDPKSGLIRYGTSTEELLGICPFKDPDQGWARPIACLSTRTEIVTIEITPRGN